MTSRPGQEHSVGNGLPCSPTQLHYGGLGIRGNPGGGNGSGQTSEFGDDDAVHACRQVGPGACRQWDAVPPEKGPYRLGVDNTKCCLPCVAFGHDVRGDPVKESTPGRIQTVPEKPRYRRSLAPPSTSEDITALKTARHRAADIVDLLDSARRAEPEVGIQSVHRNEIRLSAPPGRSSVLGRLQIHGPGCCSLLVAVVRDW